MYIKFKIEGYCNCVTECPHETKISNKPLMDECPMVGSYTCVKICPYFDGYKDDNHVICNKEQENETMYE
jgi:hypothetical protein